MYYKERKYVGFPQVLVDEVDQKTTQYSYWSSAWC